MLAFILALATTGALAEESLCNSGEQVVFSCRIAKSAKFASLCASGELSAAKGGLAYRFGSAEKIELEFPATAKNSHAQFRYAHYTRPQTDRTELSFAVGDFRYSIFDYYDADEKPRRSRGITVSGALDARDESVRGPVGATARKVRDVTLLCGSQITSNLGKLEGLAPCDRSNALADCR